MTELTDAGLIIGGALFQHDGGQVCTNAVTTFASAAECTPATCADGCCDGARCIRTCAQTNTRCGVYSDACTSCAEGDRCERGYCRGTGPCAGCRNTDLCLPGTLPFSCGVSPGSCTVCESCINQQCVTPPIHIGDPCADDATCAPIGRGAYLPASDHQRHALPRRVLHHAL